jgi:hypothetical protein
MQEQTQHYFCIGAVVRLPELVLALRLVLLTTLANRHISHYIMLHYVTSISKWYKIMYFKRNLLHFEKCVSKHKCKYGIYKPQYQI